jgi:hypothetical protein
MSAESTASTLKLVRLRKELAADIASLRRIEAELNELLAAWPTKATDRASLALAAVDLHGWYTGWETALERIARAVDQSVPAGVDWHTELLRQAMTDIPGLRPAVLAEHLLGELEELRKFRHFFRHAYRVELDGSKLFAHMERVRAIAPAIHGDLARFDDFLRASIEDLAAR